MQQAKWKTRLFDKWFAARRGVFVWKVLVQHTDHKKGPHPRILIFKSSMFSLRSAKQAGLYIQIRCCKVWRDVSVYQLRNLTVSNASSKSIVTKVLSRRMQCGNFWHLALLSFKNALSQCRCNPKERVRFMVVINELSKAIVLNDACRRMT
jgi:hypothetical protein